MLPGTTRGAAHISSHSVADHRRYWAPTLGQVASVCDLSLHRGRLSILEGQLGMACNGGSIIASVLEHLKLEDVQLLLENRGMPCIGDKEQLTERLQVQIRPSACVVPLSVIHSSKKFWKH